MRTLNLRLAGILIAITIVFGAGVYFLHGYQQKRNAVFFLEQADVAKQQYDKAHEEKKTEEEEKALEQQLKYLQWYISFRPDDLKAIEQLALILADRVNNPRTYMQAYSLLDKVVRDDSSRNKARRKLIQLAILGERFSDAHYHLSNLLNETADDPELLDLLGQCQEGMGENAAAAESYNKAIESSPKLLDTYWRLASLLRVRLERPAEADKAMQKLVENNPDSTKAYVYRGNYLRSIGSTEEAMKTSEQALEISADDQDALLLAAQCAMASGDLVKARKYAEHCLENHRDIGIIYTVLAEIFLRGEDREKAIDILDQGLKETKNAAPILWFKANLLIDNENVDQAKETIKKIRATEYPKPLVDYLDARVVFLQKNWAEASRQLEKVRPSMSAYPQFVKQVDLWLGYCYGKLNNSDQEIRAYQRALAIDPFFATARQYLTDALVKSGRFEEAIQEYIKLAKMGALPPSGLIALANAMIRQTLQKDVNERQWGPVEQALANAEQRNPGVLQIDLLRAEILHAQDKNAEAEKILLKAVEKYPRQIDCWNALLTMVAVQKKWEQAETILGNFEKYFGDTVDVRSIKAEYFIQRYGPKAGENLMRLTENTANFSDAELVRLWGGLLNAARRINDKEVAQHMLDLLAQKDVKNLDIQYLRMEQAANAGDIPTLEITLADVEKIEGQGPLWLVGQARLLILKAKDSDPDKLDEALGCLMKAHELRPSWSRVYLLIGSIYDTQKKYVRALTNLREAINLGERNPAIVHRVVQLLFQQQNYKDADKLLRQLDHEQVPFTIELTRMWVQLLLRQDEFDLAATKAREAVSSKTDEYHDYLWLGQVLWLAARHAKSQGQTDEYQKLIDESENSMRHAVELKSDTAETWVTLVQFLRSVKKMSEAEEVVNQAREKIPPEQALSALAQCYEAIDKNDLALEQYKLLLASKPDDPKIVQTVADFYVRTGKSAEAEELFRQILDGKVKADKDNLMWARRQMAMIIAAKGGLMNTETARAMIEQNLAVAADSVDDLRIKVRLNALDPRRSRKDEALRVLEKMKENKQATEEDLYNLALLYLSNVKPSRSQASSLSTMNEDHSNAWTNASTILLGLVTANTDQPLYLATYAKSLLDHGDVASAELYLNKLLKDFPNMAPTVSLKAEIMVRRGQYEEALDLMKKFVDQKGAIPPDRFKRIHLMAETMERLMEKIKDSGQKEIVGRYARNAEMLYQLYYDEHPSESLGSVTYFTRQDRIEEAINSLEEHWSNDTPVNVAQASINIVARSLGTKEIIERVKKVLADAEVKFENNPAITLTLGDINLMQGNYSPAEADYRKVLQNNPEHSVALNNLAVLLTLQGKNLDEALSMINKAIEISGPLGSMLDTRACVYIAQGNAELALKDITEAVADTTTPLRLFHQAQAFQLGNQNDAAASAMQQALNLGLIKEILQEPEFPAFDKLKQLVQEKGSQDQAEE